MLAALCLLALQPQPATVDLYRGAGLAAPRYWDVEDTYIDASDPDTVFGGSYTLLGGKGKAILIRFGDLNRVVGPNRHVTRAVLYLTPSGGDVPVLHGVSRVLVPWGEGPRTVITRLFAPPPTTGKAAKVEGPRWAANYRQRRTGYASWQAPGADGAEDAVPIPGTSLDHEAKEFAIHGLEGAVQQMLDDPSRNFGFRLAFDSESEFWSCKSPVGRPRLEIQTVAGPAPTGPDLSVVRIERTPADAREGQDVTYTAHIRNVGDAPSKPFSATWMVGERPDKPVDVSTALEPGAETTVTLQRKLDIATADHRIHPLGVRIVPIGPDSGHADKELTIDEDAIPIDVVVRPEAARTLSGLNYLGTHSLEDWVQAQVRLWNDTYASESRFSFAPEGALERIRVNSITIDANAAGPVVEADASPLAADAPFLRRLGLAAGLFDGKVMEIDSSKVQIPGSTTRSSYDLYPGLMGYGDTRFDGQIAAGLGLCYQPVVSSILDEAFLEPTDLLSATDVCALNEHTSQKPVKPSDDLLPIKKTVLIRAKDLTGRVLQNVDLDFFQSTNGAFPSGDPVFAAKTNEEGVAILNGRGTAGPFGDLAPDGGNGVFLIQAKANGVLETGWLKAWELNEDAQRGVIMTDLYLNLPELPVDRTTNLVNDKIITDSANDLPAKLAPLIDDTIDTTTVLPDAKDSWVEIDLGRDRTISEVDLVTKGDPFWQQFDIQVYGTGQKPGDAVSWNEERNWKWTVSNRSDKPDSGTGTQVAYRGSSLRVRYLRFINRSGGPGTLAKIRVYAARLGQ